MTIPDADFDGDVDEVLNRLATLIPMAPEDLEKARAEVKRLPAFVPVVYKSGLLQNREMLGNGRLRYAGAFRQCADSLFAVAAQSFEQAAPRRIGERPEDRILRD